MTREQILNKAMEIITKDRENAYGKPEDNFGMISKLWNTYLRIEPPDELSAVDVACMMCLLKLARIATGKTNIDNFIDLCGYAGCGGEISGRSYNSGKD